MNHQNDEQLDAYLWDPLAPADPSVVQVERQLEPARFDPRVHPLVFGDTDRVIRTAARPIRSWLPRLAWAAAIVIVACTGFGVWRWSWPDGRAWSIRTSGSAPAELRVGSTLTTASSNTALVQIARIGTMVVGENTSLSLRSTSSNRHRLVLEDGSVHVRVWAPPFSVGFRTPAGEVSDLGCEFELTVDGGTTAVRVTSGWVQLENLLGESLVPAGASSVMTEGSRPAVPVFDGAAPGFADSVRTHETRPDDPLAVERIVALARAQDVYTLLLLVQRRSPAAASFVDRAAQLFPPPEGVDPVLMAAGDQRTLDLWIEALPLPSPKATWLWNWRDGFLFFKGRR